MCESEMSEKKWAKRKNCSAKNCKNYQCTRADLAFHRFPKDPQRCSLWVQNLKNASLHGISSDHLHRIYRVCSAHFHQSQFKRPPDVHAGLKWNAVPTIIDAPDPSPPLDTKRKRKPPKTCKELPIKKCKQSHVPPSKENVKAESSSQNQMTKEAGAGPLLQNQLTKEAGAGPSSQTQLTKKAGAGSSSQIQLTKKAGAGPLSQNQITIEAGAGPSSQNQITKEAGAGPSSQNQLIKEAGAGPSSQNQMTKEAGAGSSSQNQITKEAGAGPSSENQLIKEAGAGPLLQNQLTKEVSKDVVNSYHTIAAVQSLTLKIKALKSQVRKLQAKVRQLQRPKVSKGKTEMAKKQLVMEELQRLLPAKAYAFVSTQLRVSQRKSQGYRWTAQDKALFLPLWRTSSKCYQLLCEVFSMPSIRTLQKTVKSVDFKTRLSDQHCNGGPGHSPEISGNT